MGQMMLYRLSVAFRLKLLVHLRRKQLRAQVVRWPLMAQLMLYRLSVGFLGSCA
jgi:hypothetical protein